MLGKITRRLKVRTMEHGVPKKDGGRGWYNCNVLVAKQDDGSTFTGTCGQGQSTVLHRRGLTRDLVIGEEVITKEYWSNDVALIGVWDAEGNVLERGREFAMEPKP